MAQITKLTATFDDGTTQDIDVTASATPAVATITEVDVLSSDGTNKKFVPAA